MTFRRVFDVYGMPHRDVAILLALQMAVIVTEGAGMGMLLPIMQFIRDDGHIEALTADSGLWRIIERAFEAVGLGISLEGLILISLAAMILRQITSYANNAYRVHRRESRIQRIRERYLAAYLAATRGYQQTAMSGEMANELTQEMDRSVRAVFQTVRILGSGVLVIVYVAGCVLISAPMTFLSFGVLLAAVLVTVPVLRLSTRQGDQVVTANRDVTAYLVERLANSRQIKLAGTEADEMDAFGRIGSKQARARAALQMLTERMNLILVPATGMLSLALVYFGYRLDLTLDVIGFFVIILLRLMPLAREVLGDAQAVLSTWAAAASVSDRILALDAHREKDGGDAPMPVLDRAIALRSVSFTYPGAATPALKSITLEIAAGRMTAVVGPSGAGKSTLIDLLPRVWEPTAGTILIDDVPLPDIRLSALRGAIGYVPQRPLMFNVSVREHLCYGCPAATPEAMERAADLAGATDFIRALPEGWETLLGEGGDRLSGGQRQRLELARALLRGGRVLILDEPSSGLDPQSARHVQDALERIRAETSTTIVLIAHTPEAVRNADTIIVLRDGRVIDRGPHDVVSGHPGWYRDVFLKTGETAPPSV